jgi:hypothetical protein
MKDVFKAFEVDKDYAYGKGAPLVINHPASGEYLCTLYINRAGNSNKAYTQAVLNSSAKFGEADLSEDMAAEILLDAYSQAVVVGWKDVYKDGKKLAYSSAACRSLLENKDILNIVQVAASRIATFQKKHEEKQTKN